MDGTPLRWPPLAPGARAGAAIWGNQPPGRFLPLCLQTVYGASILDASSGPEGGGLDTPVPGERKLEGESGLPQVDVTPLRWPPLAPGARAGAAIWGNQPPGRSLPLCLQTAYRASFQDARSGPEGGGLDTSVPGECKLEGEGGYPSLPAATHG